MAASKTLVPVNKSCPGCGEAFRAETWYQIHRQEFCSRACRSAVHGNGRLVAAVAKACAACGAEMTFSGPAEAALRRTCSYACRSILYKSGVRSGSLAPAWSGGSSEWWKQEARLRDRFACRYPRCRRRGNLVDAHHKVPADFGGSDSLQNLITLCDVHHQKLERAVHDRLVGSVPRSVGLRAARRVAKLCFPPRRAPA